MVPLNEHPDNLELSQSHQDPMSSPVTTTADLNAHLQVLTSSATTGQMSDLGVVTQELPQGMGESRGLPFLEKQLEAHEKGLEALLNGGGLLIL